MEYYLCNLFQYVHWPYGLKGTCTILNSLHTSVKKGQQQLRTHSTQIVAIYSMQCILFHILLCNIFYAIYLYQCIAHIDKKEHVQF